MDTSRFLSRLYGVSHPRIKTVILRIVERLEGGEFHSRTLREIFRTHYDVDIGMYTHGACFTPGYMDRYTTIGRYSSVARTARVFNRNHPLEFKSTHGFFFNPSLGYLEGDPVEYIPLHIGNDVWLGHNSIILPNVRVIGDGAVVAAGAVVNKDIPPYGVAVGNPARVVRFRFSKENIARLLASRWWEHPIEELKEDDDFGRPYESVRDRQEVGEVGSGDHLPTPIRDGSGAV